MVVDGPYILFLSTCRVVLLHFLDRMLTCSQASWRRLFGRLRATQPAHPRPGVHVRAGESQHANQLLHRHLFRQVAANCDAHRNCGDGIPRSGTCASFWIGRRACLRLLDHHLAPVWRWKETFEHASLCATMVRNCGGHACKKRSWDRVPCPWSTDAECASKAGWERWWMGEWVWVRVWVLG